MMPSATGSISVLVQWGAFPGVVVDGIYPLGKGLATGIVQDPLEATEFKRRQDEGLMVRGAMP